MWTVLTKDKNILNCTQGYKIPFQEIPQQAYPPEEWNEDFDNLKIDKIYS